MDEFYVKHLKRATAPIYIFAYNVVAERHWKDPEQEYVYL